MNLKELKKKSPGELISQAEKLQIENPSTLRKQEILFAILKKLAEKMSKLMLVEFLKYYKLVLGFCVLWNLIIYLDPMISMLAPTK